MPLDPELKSELQGMFHGVVQSLKKEIQAVKHELQEEIQAVRVQIVILDGKISNLEKDLSELKQNKQSNIKDISQLIYNTELYHNEMMKFIQKQEATNKQILDELAYFKEETSLIHRNLTILNTASSDYRRALSDLETNMNQLRLETQDQLYHSHRSTVQLLNGLDLIREQTAVNVEEIMGMRELM